MERGQAGESGARGGYGAGVAGAVAGGEARAAHMTGLVEEQGIRSSRFWRRPLSRRAMSLAK